MLRLLLTTFLGTAAAVILVSAVGGAPPPLKLPADFVVNAADAQGADVTYSVEARDPIDVVNCSPPAGTTGVGSVTATFHFPVGTTTVSCNAVDPSNVTLGTGSFTVTVVDQPPIVSVPSGISKQTTDPNVGVVVDFASDVTATDVVDGPLTPTCNPSSGSTFVLGSTTVTCTATDTHGNTGSASFVVTVTLLDNQPPTFTTVPGPISKEATGLSTPVSWEIVAVDNIDPSPTINCDPASGSSFPLGTKTVTCKATDDSGNVTTAPDFTVTVLDTTPPVLSLPSNKQVDTENPAGTSVSYSATASDLVAGSITPSCSPSSGAPFVIGTTTVNCSANDGHGNTASGNFTVVVKLVDQTAPVFTGTPSNRQVEANGPAGSVVNFPIPTATDALDGPIATVVCTPASGSTFPLGTTTVTCTASDSHGNTGTASFSVSVIDTTKPTLTVPSDRTVYADTPNGISAQSYGASGFLAGASAVDTVDQHPVVSNNAPEFFGVGTHVVTFSARDASGNSVSKNAILEVLPMPPAGTPPLPIPPDRVPPTDVQALKAEAGDGRVRLSWQAPNGVDHVVISRSLTAGGDAKIVYTGSAKVFTDRDVVNDLEYRYVVVSVNATGDTSAGVAVVALPKRTLLKAPKDGARLRKVPKLIWLKNPEASYYNVQLFRGTVKILSTWPVRPSLALTAKWKYEARRYRLSPGIYRWYVWPGFGARKAVAYGAMLGFSTFQIVR